MRFFLEDSDRPAAMGARAREFAEQGMPEEGEAYGTILHGRGLAANY